MPATVGAPRLSAMTMSPGCRVGTKIWSMEARKLSPSIAPSKPPGAVSPVTRHAARNVLVCQRPQGAWGVDACATRCPAVPPQQIGGAAGFVQTHEGGDIPGRRRRVPRDPRGRDVRPIVFGRADRCF